MKFEGDGAAVSKHTSMIILNVALVDSVHIHAVLGRKMLACVAGYENYDTYRICFRDVIAFANAVNKRKTTTFEWKGEEKTVKLEVFLGGDYKFLLSVLGMNAANSDYACAFCYIHAVRGLAKRE